MGLLVDLAYLAASPVALPALAVKSLRTGKYRADLAGRFGFGGAVPRKAVGEKRLLLHCVSVGELNSVQTLVARLLAAEPRLRIVITTTTDTGTARVQRLYSDADKSVRVVTMRFPFDFSFAVERLFDRVEPDLAALVELETWPNFLAIAQSRRVPVALVNGRISDKSFPRYAAIRPLMAGMLRQVAWIGAQTETIARRFAALGAPAERVEVLPTLKYDNAAAGERVPGQEALAAAMGLAGGLRLFAAGSTGPGEEEFLLDAYQQVRAVHPALRLAIAPRHPEVVAQVLAAIAGRGLRAMRRSQTPDGIAAAAPLSAGDIFVLDTMGELRKLYALADAVFVGRSLLKKGGGGSDMIEVAALGKPCCFGPFTANFTEVVELLLAEGTAVRVADGAALTQALEGWLANPDAARQMGTRARAVIRRQQGSTDVYVQRLLSMLSRGRLSPCAPGTKGGGKAASAEHAFGTVAGDAKYGSGNCADGER